MIKTDMPDKKGSKVALVEISNGHDECLYSQILFLKSIQAQIYLICSKEIFERVSSFEEISDFFVVDLKDRLIKTLFLIRKYILKNEIQKVVFNTVHDSITKKLLMFPFKKGVEFIGVLHNISKLNSSLGMKIISRKVKKIYVLSDYLYNKINKEANKGLKFGVFYPIFFPDFKEIAIKKAENQIWVCIPGQVEQKRRDYSSLFKQLESKPLNENIVFILLGKSMHEYGDGEQIKKKIEALNLQRIFVLWEGYIDNNQFHTYLKQSDYIMPLIHPKREGFDVYLNNKISGAFNLAFGYKIPLILESSFETLSDFKSNTIFYKENELLQTINDIAEHKRRINNDAFANEKWSLRYQSNKYLDFFYS